MNTEKCTSCSKQSFSIRWCFLALPLLYFHSPSPLSFHFNCFSPFFWLVLFLNISTFFICFSLYPAILPQSFLRQYFFSPSCFFPFFSFYRNDRFKVIIWVLKGRHFEAPILNMSAEEMENCESPFESANHVI